MAFSRIVDLPGNAVKFDISAMESEEARWYMDLPNTKDQIGSIGSLNAIPSSTKGAALQKPQKKGRSKSQSKPNGPAAKIVAIEEKSEGDEEEDDDLMMYEKPDTDASDSEDDATLVQRSKPSSPV